MKIAATVLVLLLGFCTWRFYAEPLKEKKTRHTHFPQEYMKNVIVDAYSETGEKKHHLSADYWEYLPSKKASTLLTPHLIVYKPDKTVWQIDALEGHVTQPTLGSIEQLELSHQVVLQRPPSDHAVALKLETERLRYLPKKEFAETEERVTFFKPGAKVTGVGMRAYLDKQAVEILNDVQTQFIMSSK